MPARSSIAIRNAQLTATAGLLGGALLRIYSGSQPATVESAAPGTLLATLTLNTWPAPSGGLLTTTDISPEVSATGGTAGWFRIWESDGTAAHYDGTVTAPGGGGTITLDPVVIAPGATVALSSFTITRPASS